MNDSAPAGNQAPFDTAPIPGGNAAIPKSDGGPQRGSGPRHAPGPGKTVAAPTMPTKHPTELDDNDIEDIRKMGREMGFDDDGPMDESDEKPTMRGKIDPGEQDNDDKAGDDLGGDESGDDTGIDEAIDDEESQGGDETEVIAVTEDDYTELVFQIGEGDAAERVNLGTLLSERYPREQLLADKREKAEALRVAEESRVERDETVEYYRGITDMAMMPHQFLKQYLDNHVKNGIVTQELRDAIVNSFADPDFGYRAQEVESRAQGVLQQRQQEQQRTQQMQERRLKVIRTSMETIAKKYNEGKWLDDAQQDRLYGHMQQMQRERGDEVLVTPLEAFALYRDEVMGVKVEKKREIGKTRQAVVRRLQNRRSNVPGAGPTAAGGGGKGPTLERLAADAESEFTRSARR